MDLTNRRVIIISGGYFKNAISSMYSNFDSLAISIFRRGLIFWNALLSITRRVKNTMIRVKWEWKNAAFEISFKFERLSNSANLICGQLYKVWEGITITLDAIRIRWNWVIHKDRLQPNNSSISKITTSHWKRQLKI